MLHCPIRRQHCSFVPVSFPGRFPRRRFSSLMTGLRFLSPESALILNECVTGREGMLCRSHVARGCEGCLAHPARPWCRLPAPVEPPPWQLLGARVRVVFRCGTATGTPAAPNPHHVWTGTPRPHVYRKKQDFQPDRPAHVTCPQGSPETALPVDPRVTHLLWRVLRPPFPSQPTA